jgi:hypothetical protein
MAKIIDVPGMGHVEFPDAMSDDQIVQVIQRQNLDLAKQTVSEPQTSLAGKLAMAVKPTETFPQYAGRAVKEMAIPMATTAAGTFLGGLPGGMAGSALGETLNQSLGVYGKSVIPEANQPDLTRIGVAGVAPAVIPAVVKAGEIMKRAGAKTAEKFGPIAMSNAWLRDKIGPYTDDAARVLTQPSPLPSYPQTAAEKMVGSEFGPVIQGHQQAVAQTPGGISTEFAKLKKFQDFALEQGAHSRNAVTGPMREAALDAANAKFGIKANAVLKAVNQELATPEVKGAPASEKALNAIRDKLIEMKDQYGRIDARTLYQYKKEGLDQVVDAAMDKADPKISEAFRATRLIGVKKAIDDAIDDASGGLWKPYLAEYSGRSKVLDTLMENREAMYKPIQRADLRGGVDIAPSAAHQILPPWLSRPVTTTKWLAERYASHIEPKIDRYMANLYQHPDQLAAVLQSPAVKPPSRYDLMIQELMKRQAPLAAGAATQQ